MKKSFEFILVLIIFYGVYSAFEKAIPVLFNNPKDIWIIVSALIVSALILVLYSFLIGSEIKLKMKKDIDELKSEIKNKNARIIEKDEEVKKAQSFKEDLIIEAEQSETVG